MSSIIVYFSRNGKNYVNGEIKELAVGNTEVAAKMIQEITGADIFKIDPIIPYPDDYQTCTEEAKNDLHNQARPELKSYPSNVEQYEVIYLGYPNYWGTMPMAVWTFLEKYDFSGKTIKPFCTNEGSGMGNSEADIVKLCPNAIIKKGLAIHGSEVSKSKDIIQRWALTDLQVYP